MHLHERSKHILAQGFTGTNSKRPAAYTTSHPQFITKAEKCYVTDATGKKYIDFVGGLGTVILGYNHPKVNEAAIAQIKTGAVTTSLANPLEVELAETIRELCPKMEQIRFLKTGSEAVHAAVRIARAKSGLRYVYTDGYHGWHDSFTSIQYPAAGCKDQHFIRHIEDDWDWPGAVIIEPVKLELTDERGEELKRIKERCITSNVPLIFDEVVTGWRVPKFTVTEHYQLSPDLIVMGKCLGNGFPISVVGGSTEIMSDKSYFVSSTFSGEAVSLAAATATIQELRQRNMKDLLFYGSRLVDRLNGLHDDVRFQGYGSRAMMHLDNENAAIFAQEAAKAGILFGKAFFFNFSHIEENVEEVVLNRCLDIITKMKTGRCKLEGPMPEESFKR